MCVSKWKGLAASDSSLQSTIIDLLEDNDYRFRAALHLATLDILETIDKVWKWNLGA